MNRLPILSIVLILVLSFCGCGVSSPSSESVLPPSSPESTPSEPASSIPDYVNKPEVPIIGELRADVDFLTEEQWVLYDNGKSYLSYFLYDPGYFYGDSNTLFNIRKDIDGWDYYQYSSEKYPSYDAFYQDVLTVFTPELYETLNYTMKPLINEPAPPIYVDVEGDLYYLNCTGGADLTHLHDQDRYELVAKDEKRIEFEEIAYYCEHDDVSLENPIPVEMKSGSIVMEKAEDGWRISKIDCPDYLGKTGRYDTDINPD